MRRPRGLRHDYNKEDAMKVQKFVVTIEYSEKDGCGNIIAPKIEREVRCAIQAYIAADFLTVDEIKEA